MDYSSYKLAVCQTIPHTGTHMLLYLIHKHPAMGWITITRHEELVDSFLRGEINNYVFKQKLLDEAFAIPGPQVPKGFKRTSNDYLFNVDQAEPTKCIFLFSHVRSQYTTQPVENVNCVQDIMDKIKLPQVITLRDPLLVVCTILMVSSGNQASISRGIEITRVGFNFIQSIDLNSTCVFPVDLLAAQLADQRIETIRRLCKDFFGVPFLILYEDIITKWIKMHPTDYSKHWDGKIPLDILKCKEMIMRGENPKGINSIVDRELEYYSGHTELKNLFKSFGYKDLLWF